MSDDKNLELEQLEEYEPIIIDLEGEKFEIIDTIEVDGKNYAALTPYTEDDDLEGSEVEFIILEIGEDDGEQCTLKTVDDEALYSKIGDKFLELFSDEFPDDEE